jgi:hypothetical protein
MNVEPPGTLVIIESIVYKSNGFAIIMELLLIFIGKLEGIVYYLVASDGNPGERQQK